MQRHINSSVVMSLQFAFPKNTREQQGMPQYNIINKIFLGVCVVHSSVCVCVMMKTKVTVYPCCSKASYDKYETFIICPCIGTMKHVFPHLSGEIHSKTETHTEKYV